MPSPRLTKYLITVSQGRRPRWPDAEISPVQWASLLVEARGHLLPAPAVWKEGEPPSVSRSCLRCHLPVPLSSGTAASKDVPPVRTREGNPSAHKAPGQRSLGPQQPPSGPRVRWAQRLSAPVALDQLVDGHPFPPTLFNFSSGLHSPSGEEVRLQDASLPPWLHHPLAPLREIGALGWRRDLGASVHRPLSRQHQGEGLKRAMGRTPAIPATPVPGVRLGEGTIASYRGFPRLTQERR